MTEAHKPHSSANDRATEVKDALRLLRAFEEAPSLWPEGAHVFPGTTARAEESVEWLRAEHFVLREEIRLHEESQIPKVPRWAHERIKELVEQLQSYEKALRWMADYRMTGTEQTLHIDFQGKAREVLGQ